MMPPPRPDWSTTDLASQLVTEPEPAAALESLAMAEWWTRAVACAPYAATLRIVEGVTSPATTRRLTISVAVGCRYGRWQAARYGYGDGVAQSSTQVSADEAGLAVYSVAASPVGGSSALGPYVQQGGDYAALAGGDDTDTSNGNAALVELTESLAVGSMEVEVQNVVAFAMHVPAIGQSADLETV